MIDAITLIPSSLCKALIITANTESQISNQTGERDVFDERVRRAR